MHVFGFPEKSEYVAIAGNGAGDVFAGQKFAHWLIDGGHLDALSQAEVHDGDIVFYFDGSNFKHAGLLIQGRVTSKWGLGELYQHELLEVPSSYGSDFRFYRGVEDERALELFRQFAKESGVDLKTS